MSEEITREILRQQGMTESEIDQALADIKRGIQAWREGKFKSWAKVKEELGIE